MPKLRWKSVKLIRLSFYSIRIASPANAENCSFLLPLLLLLLLCLSIRWCVSPAKKKKCCVSKSGPMDGTAEIILNSHPSNEIFISTFQFIAISMFIAIFAEIINSESELRHLSTFFFVLFLPRWIFVDFFCFLSIDLNKLLVLWP